MEKENMIMTLSEAQTKLLAALQDVEAPAVMLDRALDGTYDDYKSDEISPIHKLVTDAHAFGLTMIAERAKRGDFDGTKADSDAWAASMESDREMGPMLKALGLGATV